MATVERNSRSCSQTRELVNYEDVRKEILETVQERLSLLGSICDEDVLDVIEKIMLSNKQILNMSTSERKRMRKELFNRIRRFDVLSDLMDDDAITEIMVNGTDDIFIERNGRIINSGVHFESQQRLFDIAVQIAAGVNRSINILSPILDARLPQDGSRVNIVLNPIALNGPILTIRRFPATPMSAHTLIEAESVTEEVLDFISKLVKAKYNILISGGTGSGKTTFLNICSGYIPADERIITIEDSAELRIMNIRNLVRLETRNKATNGTGEITIRDLIKSALRMRPDRIIVGEVRGEEAIDMLQAFSVGQDGSLSTIHANHSQDALYRLETMIMLSTNIPMAALRRQIASGIDIIVQLGRLRDGSRKLLEIREVTGIVNNEIETSLLYMFKEKIDDSPKAGKVKGTIVKCNDLKRTEKLLRAGISYG